MDFENLTDEVVDVLINRLLTRLSSLPVSEYAKTSCEKGINSGLFADGDKDGLVDNPQGFLRRQELAVVLDRAGVLDGRT
jgi:hypothetical protein